MGFPDQIHEVSKELSLGPQLSLSPSRAGIHTIGKGFVRTVRCNYRPDRGCKSEETSYSQELKPVFILRIAAQAKERHSPPSHQPARILQIVSLCSNHWRHNL